MMTSGRITDQRIDRVVPLTTPALLHHELPLDDQVLDYAVRLARTTRSWPGLALGAGPRASIALVRGGRARALLRGGEFVTPDDIKGCALAVLRHRVRLSAELDIEGLSVDQVLQQLLDQVAAPRA